MRKDIVKIIAAVMLGVLLFNITACKDSEKPAVDSSVATEPETQSDTPSEPEKVSPVYTDWSKLTPYEPKQKFTYHAGYCADEKFTARNDYGTLLAYLGQYVEGDLIEATFYGLVNDKGELVTAPVYKNIDFYDDFLVLRRDCSDNDDKIYHTVTIASSDGRWVHELPSQIYLGNTVYGSNGLLVTTDDDSSFDVWNTDGEVIMHEDNFYFLDIIDGILLTCDGNDNSLVILNADGEVIMRIDGTVIKEKIGYKGSDEDFASCFYWNDKYSGDDWIEIELYDNKVGYIDYGYWDGDNDGYGHLYLDLQSGEVMDTPPKGYPETIKGDIPKIDGYEEVYPITDSVSGEKYFFGRTTEGHKYSLFDCNCKLLADNINPYYMFCVRAGLYSNGESDYFCYRSLADNKLVFGYPIDVYEYVYEY